MIRHGWVVASQPPTPAPKQRATVADQHETPDIGGNDPPRLGRGITMPDSSAKATVQPLLINTRHQISVEMIRHGWATASQPPTPGAKATVQPLLINTRRQISVEMIRHGWATASQPPTPGAKTTVQPLLIDMTPAITEALPALRNLT